MKNEQRIYHRYYSGCRSRFGRIGYLVRGAGTLVSFSTRIVSSARRNQRSCRIGTHAVISVRTCACSG
jgi:hypothetical protein